LSTTYELTAKNSYNFLIAGNDEWIYTLSDGNKLTIYGFNNITYITLEKNYDPQAEYDKQKE
ncbi:MAG: hypothetical protein LIO93_12230, partial [Bacteroidales bacterium]|nr:hypothetical protein [Bacteroidales bacterium]